MTSASSKELPEQVDRLIGGPQYAMPQREKDAILTPILRELSRDMASRCPPYARFLERFGGDAERWRVPADVPPLPVSAFKRFLLSGVPEASVVRELRSSATTGQQFSRILIDKTTAFRQARALVSILKDHIGGQRRPFLVLDAPESAAPGAHLTARGAAIRGVANFASETVYAMRAASASDVEVDWDLVQGFFDAHQDRPVLLFGFTFIVWERFLLEAERRGVRSAAPGAALLHSGGWKKLAARAVPKEQFNLRLAAVLGCAPQRILDFYGMVEQVGTVFVDCEAGHKHAPAFADVVLRRPGTLAPVGPGETGIIEVLSVLPTSYPGHATITEDQGTLIGVDDCPCSRRGKYFRFVGRIEQAEVRGCGDIFGHAEARP
jgi:hypothetical protein